MQLYREFSYPNLCRCRRLATAESFAADVWRGFGAKEGQAFIVFLIKFCSVKAMAKKCHCHSGVFLELCKKRRIRLPGSIMNTLAAIAIPIPSWHIIHHRAHAICVNAYVATITDYDLVVIFFYVAPALFFNEIIIQSQGRDYFWKVGAKLVS